MTFHSLPSLLPVHKVFRRRKSCYHCWLLNSCRVLISADAVHNTCAVVWFGRGENQEDRGLLSLNLRHAQVLVAAVSKIRWFLLGFRISSIGPTGEKPLFMHPKVTTLSFLCHRRDGRGNRTSCRAQGVRGGWGMIFRQSVWRLEGAGPHLKWLLPHSRGHFKCLLSYSHLGLQFEWMWSQQKC